MTNEEIRAELQAIVPSLLAEVQGRRLRQGATGEASASWRKMTLIVRYLAQQVIHASVSRHVDADDVSQRVMLKLQSEATLSRMTRSDLPLAYLRGLIRFAVLDHIRTLERSSVSLEEIGETAGAPAPEPRVLWRRSEPPAKRRAEPVAVQNLRRLLRRLGPDERRLLKMRFWHNMSVAEIAKELGEPPSRVSVRLFRLIGRLRKAGRIR
jgi:RNA polymerase sigma factor (sigma-70 family)